MLKLSVNEINYKILIILKKNFIFYKSTKLIYAL